MNVLHVAAECAPLVKVGGMGDVVGALPKYLRALGIEAGVALPKYGAVKLETFDSHLVHEGTLQYDRRDFEYCVWYLPGDALGFPVWLFDEPVHFGYPGIYQDPETGRDFPNQADRFFVFQLMVLDFLHHQETVPDVIHVHDHHTGLIPALIRDTDRYPRLRPCRLVFNVHNAVFQGNYDWPITERLPVALRRDFNYLHYDQLNLMKAALYGADRVVTVSPSYAQELMTDEETGASLQGVFAHIATKLEGILNGIDPDVWHPSADSFIAERYDRDSLEKKAINKAALCEMFGFIPDRPVLTYIGRLFYEKGVELLPEALAGLLHARPDAQVVLLGSGSPEHEATLRQMARDVGESRLALRLEFNNTLAHQLYAGADILLMPSRFEPCGLNQMYALTYGTIPVVHAVGGLRDTVEEWAPLDRTGNGFRFEAFAAHAFLDSLLIALQTYDEPDAWHCLQQNAMADDWSWLASAQRYAGVYEAVLDRDVK